MDDCASELGEFSSEYCIDDELVDPFFDLVDEYGCSISLKSEMPNEKHFDDCINALHYG